MDAWLWLSIAIVVSGVMAIFQIMQRRWSMGVKDINWPPGPRKLPIIGNLHQLKTAGKPVHVNLAKLARQYRGLMTIWFGSRQPTVIVSDRDLAWEVLVSKSSDFSARNLTYLSRFLTEGGQTVATSDLGPYWYKLRNGLQTTTLGPDNLYKHTPFQEEDVSGMLLSLHNEASANGGVVYPLLHLRKNTIKLIGRLCFGPQFKDDIFVDKIDHAIDDVMRLSVDLRLVGGFEFFRYITGLNGPFTELKNVKQSVQELIHPYISNHKLSSQNCPDYCYLQCLISQGFCEDIISCIVSELFLLAVDSVSATTTWALAFLIHYPQVQQKLYEDVCRETEGGVVKVDTVKNIKFLHAVVKETMRMKPIAPLAVPHRAARDSTLGGTKIVAGTTIVVNLYKLLHDPDYWVEPHRFMPDRFLASSVISGEMERCFLPFGAGRRMCAGMELGKLQVAFTLASLVKRFKWTSVVDDQLPDMSEDLTFVLMMKTPLAACITPRSS